MAAESKNNPPATPVLPQGFADTHGDLPRVFVCVCLRVDYVYVCVCVLFAYCGALLAVFSAYLTERERSVREAEEDGSQEPSHI